MAFEFFSTASQGSLIGLDLMVAAADVRRFMRSHATMFV
jgi:hypothetical protein